ncbi:MAG TPA: SPW repeat protein [Pyrinomonadaceae bacterium]|jgi:hypothetical protein
MAIEQTREVTPGSEHGAGVDVGTQAGTGQLSEAYNRTGMEQGGSATDLQGMTKVLKPLPHAVMDYAWAGTMMAAPWLFGFSRNRKATTNAVVSGAGILALSLMTKYPLGAVKLVPFPTHGVIETVAGVATAASPWLMGFSRNRSAKWTHLLAGLGTLMVVAMTDYRAAEQQESDQ